MSETDVLVRCASGEVPAPIAAMRVLMRAATPEDARAQVCRALERTLGDARVRLQQVDELIARHPSAWTTVRSLTAAVRHEPHAASWAELFDTAVKLSAEGSVALYTLGDPELLEAATAEIVGLLATWAVLGRKRRALDIGCGIGRLEYALASLLRSIVGIDVSGEMIGEARRRCAELRDVTFEVGSGCDLSRFAPGSFDLVLLVDTFPYLLLSSDDAANACLREVSRVLRADGDVVLFNVSYRGNWETDKADLARLASKAGLQVQRSVEQPCRLWDAPAFHLTARS
jgi:SAM-dependent methyltransferase